MYCVNKNLIEKIKGSELLKYEDKGRLTKLHTLDLTMAYLLQLSYIIYQYMQAFFCVYKQQRFTNDSFLINCCHIMSCAMLSHHVV